MQISLKKLSILGLLICMAVLAAAFYLEYQFMLATCPLCILQRMAFAALSVVFLLGIIFPLRGLLVYIYSSLIILFAFGGAALAARQIWLQYFAPPQDVTCAASLSHLINIYPFLEAIKIALAGSGECATIDYTVLGLSLAAWSFILFSGMALAAGGVIWLQKKRQI